MNAMLSIHSWFTGWVLQSPVHWGSSYFNRHWCDRVKTTRDESYLEPASAYHIIIQIRTDIFTCPFKLVGNGVNWLAMLCTCPSDNINVEAWPVNPLELPLKDLHPHVSLKKMANRHIHPDAGQRFLPHSCHTSPDLNGQKHCIIGQMPWMKDSSWSCYFTLAWVAASYTKIWYIVVWPSLECDYVSCMLGVQCHQGAIWSAWLHIATSPNYQCMHTVAYWCNGNTQNGCLICVPLRTLYCSS